MYFQNHYKLTTISFTKTVRNKPFLVLKHFIFSIYKRTSVHLYLHGKPQLKIKNMNTDERNCCFFSYHLCLLESYNSHFH